MKLSHIPYRQLATALILTGASTQLQAASISLASTMDGSSYMSENMATGGFSRINLGDGSTGTAGFISNPASPNYANSGDRDGHYLLPTSPAPGYSPATHVSPTATGTGWDLFPRETNFQVGNLTFDDTGFTGIGTETFTVTAIDLSGLWTSDPNRTVGTPGSMPSKISDISDHAIGLWFFGSPGGISFGALDAADTITFTNGILTSIDIDITTVFTISAYNVAWDGNFSISGRDISYQINDTAGIPGFGLSTFVADLNGTVNAVIPEPSTALLGALGVLFLARRRR